MVALKGYKKVPEGEKFMANSRDAKVLKALRMADYANGDQTYMTRDMTSGSPNLSKPAPPAPLLVSDAVRAFAAENGIDLATVKGTGQGGRILKSDIQALIKP